MDRVKSDAPYPPRASIGEGAVAGIDILKGWARRLKSYDSLDQLRTGIRHQPGRPSILCVGHYDGRANHVEQRHTRRLAEILEVFADVSDLVIRQCVKNRVAPVACRPGPLRKFLRLRPTRKMFRGRL